jgi:hypothetical protein
MIKSANVTENVQLTYGCNYKFAATVSSTVMRLALVLLF